MEMAMIEKTTAPEQPAAQEMGDRLGELLERMTRNTDRMQRVIDRAFGSTPEAASTKSQPREVPMGAIGVARDRIGDLHTIANQQSALLDQIDRIV
jgi:hypothetical protein